MMMSQIETFIMEIQNILQADLLDILFEGRNKAYGAYELRKTYGKRMLTALSLTFTCCLALFLIYRAIGSTGKHDLPEFVTSDILLDNVHDKIEKAPVIPPPPKKLEAAPVRQVMLTTPLIVQEAPKEEMPPTQEDLSQAKIGLANVAGDNTNIDIIAPPADGIANGVVSLPEKKADHKDSLYLTVQIESSYPGGMSAWMRFLNKKLSPNYPQEAIEKGIQGRVVVQFIVDREGVVSDVQAISGPEELKEVAVKVIRQSGKWIPAIQNGNKVKSYKAQPITFALE